MIIGTGIDIVGVDRIRQSVNRHGSRFIKRVFTPDEAAYCRDKASWPQHFAGRFAAKEAVAKALGMGFTDGVLCRDIAIERDDAGGPGVVLSGRAAELADEMAIHTWHVSISHCAEYAVASAIAEGDAGSGG